MTVDEVIALIEQEADPRGIAHWEKRFPDSALRSFGVGLTRLRKLAKQVRWGQVPLGSIADPLSR